MSSFLFWVMRPIGEFFGALLLIFVVMFIFIAIYAILHYALKFVTCIKGLFK